MAPMRSGRALALLVALLLGLLPWSATQPPAEAAPLTWWNSSYAQRAVINVTASSSDVPAGYTMNVTFDHAALVGAGQSLSSGNDLRVARWNGQVWTELDRVLAPGSSWNNASTQIRFKTSSFMSANRSDDSYYLYYSYAGAGSPPANANNVYDLYDDFSVAGAPDAGKWAISPTAGVTIANSGGELRVNGSASFAERCYGAGIYSAATFPAGRKTEATVRAISMSPATDIDYFLEAGLGTTLSGVYSVVNAPTKQSAYYNGSTWVNIGPTTIQGPTYGPTRLTQSLDAAGAIRSSENGVLQATRAGAPTNAQNAWFTFGPCTTDAFDVRFDDAMVMKYVTNEPTASVQIAPPINPQIGAGDGTTCMVAVNNAGFCWGSDNYGQLGNGATTGTQTRADLVAGGYQWANISTGLEFTCGVTTAGVGYCWGDDQIGQLGNGGALTAAQNAPSPVSGGLTFKSIITSRNSHACGITTADDMYCWGEGTNGRLGVNSTTDYNSPQLVNGGRKWQSMSLGAEYTCGVTTGGDGYCWGLNTSNQLGDGTSTQRLTPRAVAGGHKFTNIAAGYISACGLRTDASAYCWGWQSSGRLGNGSSATSGISSPVAVNGSHKFKQITAGDNHACGIRTDNAAYCWGQNDVAQLGDTSTTNRTSPVAVAGGLSFISISGGYQHSCGITTTNLPKCWGGAGGLIGDGASTQRSSPVNAFVTLSIHMASDSKPEGNSGTTVFTGDMASSNGYSPIPITIGYTTDPVSATPGVDYEATSGSTVIAPGATTSSVSFNVYGDTTLETDEMFWVSPSFISTGGQPGGPEGEMYISNDDVGEPLAPTSPAQTRTDTTTIGIGAWTNQSSVRFTASGSHQAGSANLQLCVETQPINTPFTGTAQSCGSSTPYSGTPVALTHTVSTGLGNGTQYHWQVRVKDGSGIDGPWTTFGGNAETAADFGIDTSGPSAGTVRDGATQGVDSALNDGALNQLSGNWTGFSDASSGVASYEYSIGTSAGGTQVTGWTSTGATEVIRSGLSLRTGINYYFNVRAIDNVGNVGAEASSNGQIVAPTLTFGTSTNALAFDPMSQANSYAPSTRSLDVTTSTNAYSGYVVRQSSSALLTGSSGGTIPGYSGAYSSPTAWTGTGFGYTSNDTSIQGSGNLFQTATAYAAPKLSVPGDIVADHTASVVGSPVVNETFSLTYKVVGDAATRAGSYSTTMNLAATAVY